MTRPAAAFTLVEMLVVTGILAVLLGLAVPAYTHIGAAHALIGGGNQVGDLAAVARQNSMTKNAMTALIITTDPAAANNFRACTLLQLVPHPDGSPLATTDWQQISQWEVLPTGVIVDSTSCTFDDSAATTSQLMPGFPTLHYGPNTVNTFKYVVFLPGGNLFEARNVQLRLDEGFYNAGTTVPNYAHGTANGPSDFYDIFLLSASGRAKIVRP